MVNKGDYKKLLETEMAQLAALVAQRKSLKAKLEAIGEEITRLREGVIGLAALANVDVKAKYPDVFSATTPIKADIGLTEAIRTVLKDGPGDFMTPTQVREALFLNEVYPIHLHKNPIASIVSVLKRLVDSKQVVPATDEDTGKTVYAWADSYEVIRAKLGEDDIEDI